MLGATLTTLFTTAHAGRRQRAELEHDLRLEREKLHYEHRLPIYLEIIAIVNRVDHAIPNTRPEVYLNDQVYREPIKCDELEQLFNRLDEIDSPLYALGGDDVLGALTEFEASGERLIASLKRGYTQYKEAAKPLADAMHNAGNALIEEIRREMGADPDMVRG